MVDTEQFAVGENLAVTPGAVVLRTPVFELIHYTPTTSEVLKTPLLLVPPTINKYYVLDLAPGRSLVEHLLASGQQVFVVSWRNPGVRQADWGLDTYIEAVIQALDGVREICEAEQAHLFGACSGGILVVDGGGIPRPDRSPGGARRADARRDRPRPVQRRARRSALGPGDRADAAIARSARTGYLDGRALAEVFAWLRPNDLIWNYWVNNYLLGKKPPAFDILYWNADTTRMPAHLHRDFLETALANSLVSPGEATALGTPVDLSQVTVDSYVIGGVSDHITPWQSCYRTTQTAGRHVAVRALDQRPHRRLGQPDDQRRSPASRPPRTTRPTQPAGWLPPTPTPGSWWADYVVWLADRSGARKPAPEQLGRGRFEAIADAPGTYVLDK